VTELTQARAKELLNYDAETGEFTRAKSIKGYKAGVKCGNITRNGYIEITVSRKRTLAHRLAFFWMTGAWPPNDVDHINGDRTDNRWANLRLATRTQNMWNLAPRNKGTHKHGDRWRAQIKTNGVKRHIGMFDTEAEAQAAYCKAAAEARGEFSRYS